MEHQRRLENTSDFLQSLNEGSKSVILVGDFKCKEIHWEDWSAEGEEMRGNKLLGIAMDCRMTQWVQEETRYKGDNIPARLDLILTKEPDIIAEIQHSYPLGKSDHVVIEFIALEEREEQREESYKRGWYNYRKANFGSLRKCCKETDWSESLRRLVTYMIDGNHF